MKLSSSGERLDLVHPDTRHYFVSLCITQAHTRLMGYGCARGAGWTTRTPQRFSNSRAGRRANGNRCTLINRHQRPAETPCRTLPLPALAFSATFGWRCRLWGGWGDDHHSVAVTVLAMVRVCCSGLLPSARPTKPSIICSFEISFCFIWLFIMFRSLAPAQHKQI